MRELWDHHIARDANMYHHCASWLTHPSGFVCCCVHASSHLDLKGQFDFHRLEIMVLCLVAQLVLCAGLPLCYSYLTMDLSVGDSFQHVLGSNLLVGFDVTLCLLLLLDMTKAGVAINRFCGAHLSALQEQELQRSFALTNPAARQAVGGEQAVTDSIHQLNALREKLALSKEAEKLRVFGFVLDDVSA